MRADTDVDRLPEGAVTVSRKDRDTIGDGNDVAEADVRTGCRDIRFSVAGHVGNGNRVRPPRGAESDPATEPAVAGAEHDEGVRTSIEGYLGRGEISFAVA